MSVPGWSSHEVPSAAPRNFGVHKGDVRQRPVPTIGQEPGEVVGDGAIFSAPERQGGDVSVIVAALQPVGGEPSQMVGSDEMARDWSRRSVWAACW